MNHTEHIQVYGLWSLVFIDSAIFIFFLFSFFKPETKRDWRTFGSLSAFIVALFVEMYGFPLTIYLLSGWLVKKYPGVDPFSHASGHLWHTLLGLKGNPHSDPFHILSMVVIVGAFLLLSASWRVLYQAQKEKKLAVDGPYRYVRHPQYLAFILIMVGFLLQWPTFITLVMFPILTMMYVRLAHREEREVTVRFGDCYREYAARTPGFIPKMSALLHSEDSSQRRAA